MKPEHHRLLCDLIDGSDPAARRDAVLNSGQRVLRRKRHLRYLTRTLTTTAFAGLAALVITRTAAPRPGAPSTAPRQAATSPARVVSQVQEITDDELLALFPGTPVGLVKVKGKQRLIFPRAADEARFVVHL